MACFICGNPIAPRGYQQPGPRNQRTDTRRIWACTDHVPDAEARWAKHFNTGSDRAPRRESVQPKGQLGFDL